MAITVQEINSEKFHMVKKGYDVQQVDMFMDRIAGEIDALTKALAQSNATVEIQQAAIAEYKSRECLIDQSLYEASNLREEILAKANKDADDIIKDGNATVELQKIRLQNLKLEEEQVVKRVRYILEAQLANLEFVLKEE